MGAMHNLFTLLTLLSLITYVTHVCFLTAKWNLYVISNIEDDIVAHIKSGDDDLGNHTIPFNGNYNWSFCDRIDGRTLFYGYFWWGSKFTSLALFDDELRGPCALNKESGQHCYWLVRPGGFYVSAYNRTFANNYWTFKKHWDG
ncbi:putative plant self-incompatibility S1 [Helianthus debilis subsp. tardiflorus]